MKVAVRGLKGEEAGNVELPVQFTEPVRADLIRRGFYAIAANKRQPYGAKPDAGMRHSADVSRRRRKYRGSYGFGISRVPRKIMSRRGTRMNWMAATMPGVVGGRRAHPPKATKIWTQKLNRKERRKAIRSALAASFDSGLVGVRHRVPKDYPFVIDTAFEGVSKTKDVVAAFEKLGLNDELMRSSMKTVRAGKGKSRGRKYKKRCGPLVVVSGKCALTDSAGNIPGVDVVRVDSINAHVLAPGGHPGRLTLYTKKAMEELAKGLYTQ